MIKTLLKFFVAIVIFLPSTISAQDIHLSHIHASPILLNPAMTGLFNGDLRLIGNTRSQWQAVTKGYKTVAASADMKLYTTNRGDVLGGGIQVFSDKAGDLDFRTNSTSFNISFMKAFGGGRRRSAGHFLSFGLQNSLVSNSLDYTKIVAFDFEPGVQNGAANRLNYWDVSAGVAWFSSFDNENSFHVGLSLFHINEPVVSFYKSENLTEDLLLYRKWTIHGGGDIRMGKRSHLKPSFIFKDQGPHREITIGSFWKYNTTKKFAKGATSSFYFGGWYRWHAESDLFGSDAIVAAVRLDLNKTFFTFTFDINISTLREVSYGAGGPEFSIVHIMDFANRSRRPAKVECPAFSY